MGGGPGMRAGPPTSKGSICPIPEPPLLSQPLPGFANVLGAEQFLLAVGPRVKPIGGDAHVYNPVGILSGEPVKTREEFHPVRILEAFDQLAYPLKASDGLLVRPDHGGGL